MMTPGFYLVLLLAARARAYSEGAPEEACLDMAPQHGVGPQASPSPYIFMAQQEPGGVRVSIKSNPSNGYESFKGFLVQARLASNKSVVVPGSFQLPPQDDSAQHLGCSRRSSTDTITHASSFPKQQISVLWEPPQNFNDRVVFRATILRDGHTFWMGEETPAFLVTSGNIMASPPAVERDQPSQGRRTAAYQGCSVTKACMEVPSGCIQTQNCQILLSYSFIPSGKIQFEITGSDVNPGTYLAMGISADNLMGSDSVTECVIHADGQRTQVRQSWNERRSNTPLDDLTLGLSDMAERYSDRELSCRWHRDLRTTLPARATFDLGAEKFHILLAKGPVLENGSIRRHQLRIASPSQVNFTEIAFVGSAGTSVSIQLHGTLMVIAWLLLVNLGIVLARHYKPIWQDRNPCGVKVWFFLHRGVMVSAIVLIIIALIIIFVEKKGWSSSNPHTIVGIIASVLAVVQPFMALFRPDPAHSKRFVFNWAHLIVGNAAHFCAIGAIFLSANLPDTSYLYPVLNYPLAIYIAGFAFSHIVLHFALWAIKKRVGNEIKMGELGQQAGATPEKSAPGEYFKKIFLFMYLIGMAIVVLAIIILIWV